MFNPQSKMLKIKRKKQFLNYNKWKINNQKIQTNLLLNK